jgi:hypothetical protein
MFYVSTVFVLAIGLSTFVYSPIQEEKVNNKIVEKKSFEVSLQYAINRVLKNSETNTNFDYSKVRKYKTAVLSDILSFYSISNSKRIQFYKLSNIIKQNKDKLLRLVSSVASCKENIEIDFFSLQYLLLKNDILKKSKVY